MKRQWILLFLTVLFLWAVISHFTELEQLKNTLQHGQWNWILVALLSQIAYFVVFTASYQAAFATLDITTRTRDLIPVTLGALFVNLVVPVSIAGSTTLFAQDLAQRGKPATRTATGVLLQLISDFIAFSFVLIPGLIYLFVEHDLKTYEILAAIVLLLMTIGLSSILTLGLWKPGWLYRIFDFSRRTINVLFRRLRRS